MSKDIGLGHLVMDPAAQRDAVHIAVVPVEAGEDMPPGALVKMRGGVAVSTEDDEPGIGVVDPYLAIGPEKGARFWLFLNPGSITSLRHHWGHPDFPVEEPGLALAKQVEDALVGSSKQYLEDLTRRLGYPYEEFLAELESGDGITFDNDDWRQDECEALKAEIFEHAEVVLGHKLGEAHKASFYFSCAC